MSMPSIQELEKLVADLSERGDGGLAAARARARLSVEIGPIRLASALIAAEKEKLALEQEESCHDAELQGWEEDFGAMKRRAEAAEAKLAEIKRFVTTVAEFIRAEGFPVYAASLEERVATLSAPAQEPKP